jgi:hypothetical protein
MKTKILFASVILALAPATAQAGFLSNHGYQPFDGPAEWLGFVSGNFPSPSGSKPYQTASRSKGLMIFTEEETKEERVAFGWRFCCAVPVYGIPL